MPFGGQEKKMKLKNKLLATSLLCTAAIGFGGTYIFAAETVNIAAPGAVDEGQPISVTVTVSSDDYSLPHTLLRR